ncbi:MAG: hypothetical protein JXA44_03995 [Methanospirillaceae archaeon]|nr:hypothetical protein [Methanospirillaceae archaeon]
MNNYLSYMTAFLLVLLLTGASASAETAADVPSRLPLPCDLADLQIVSAFIPSAGGAGQNLTVSMVIANTGLTPSPEVPVRVTLPNGKTVNITAAIPALDAGEKKRIVIAVFIPKGTTGNNQLSLVVDPEKTVDECSRSDNHASGPFRIISV